MACRPSYGTVRACCRGSRNVPRATTRAVSSPGRFRPAPQTGIPWQRHLIRRRSALGTGSRISGAPETFLGEVKRLQQETGVALWLVSHQNDKGELYGFKGFTFDADVVTRIIRKSNGRDHVHSRLLGRHVESRKQLSTFHLVEVGPAFVAERVDEGVAVDASKSNDIPGLQDGYRPLVSLLDDAGAADGLMEDELRDVLNSHYLMPDVKTDTVRQRRIRAKKALIEAGVLDNRDGVYYLVT